MPRPDLTEKDRALLALLKENARISITALAEHLKLSRATVQTRLKRLEDTGAIRAYRAELGPEVGIEEIRCLVLITHAPRVVDPVVAALSRIKSVKAVYSVSGTVDLIAEIATDTMAELDGIIDQIGQIDGVEKTNSHLILSTRLSR